MFKIIVGTLLLLQVGGVSMCPATNHLLLKDGIFYLIAEL